MANKKIKTKKTLLKRIKITKRGKILKRRIRISHLKEKWSTDRKNNKAKTNRIVTTGIIKNFRHMLGVYGKGIK